MSLRFCLLHPRFFEETAYGSPLSRGRPRLVSTQSAITNLCAQEPAMADPTDRLNGPVSTKEMERRWAAVRAAMDARGIDVLQMQNTNDHMGGNVKYFTDIPATNG